MKKLKVIFSKIIFKLKAVMYIKKERNRKSVNTKLFHVTYCAISNAGDTVLSKCVRRTFLMLGNYDKWDIFKVSNPVTDKVIDQMNRTAGIVCGGGGLFLPDTNKNVISGWQWAISKEQIDKISVPLIIYSVGFNYFRGQIVSDIFIDNVNHIIRKASFVGVRNKGSIKALQGIVEEDIRDKIVYQPCTTTLIRKIWGNAILPKVSSGIIGFNMAFDRETTRFGKDREIILQQVARTARLIQDRGYKIVYVMHCYDDSKFIPYLKKEGVEFAVSNLTDRFPKQCITTYNNIDLMFGMRGHAQMIPFGLNCEIISLGTHDKMKWFLEDIRSLDWYEDLTYEPEKLSERLIQKFIVIHEQNKEETKNRLLREQERLWHITKQNWKKISEIIRIAE